MFSVEKQETTEKIFNINEYKTEESSEVQFDLKKGLSQMMKKADKVVNKRKMSLVTKAPAGNSLLGMLSVKKKEIRSFVAFDEDIQGVIIATD